MFPGNTMTDITLLEICLIHNGSCHTRILQYVLTEVCVHLEDIVDCGRSRACVVRAPTTAMALFYDLGHLECCGTRIRRCLVCALKRDEHMKMRGSHIEYFSDSCEDLILSYRWGGRESGADTICQCFLPMSFSIDWHLM